MNTFQIINANSAEYLKTLPDNSVDSVITDPPYGINFLGKDWDKDTGEEEVYRQCFRVLKPGGHLLAFSAARTYHHLAMAVERSGFEIRDQIMWVYGSGFPKSQDVGRAIQRRDKTTEPNEWLGFGTALKPAHEPIVMARKPTKLSIVDNVQQWGVGAINVDACRVESENRTIPVSSDDHRDDKTMFKLNPTIHHEREETTLGRFPANFIHDGSPEVVELFPDSGEDSAARFFYCAKVSKGERNIGCEDIEPAVCINDGRNKTCDNAFQRGATITNNNHPTVKPVELMKYLIKLVTPPNSTVLDPFNGSGSTGMAAVELGHNYIGIEMDPKYCEIAKKRIEAWQQRCNGGWDPEVWEIQ